MRKDVLLRALNVYSIFQMACNNQLKTTLTSRRLIQSHIERVGGIMKGALSKELLRSVSCARRRYRMHLEQEAKREKQHLSQRKRALKLEECASITQKKQRIEKDITALQKV